VIADVIAAISDIVRLHPRWPSGGGTWLDAFDKIKLADVRRAAQESRLQPLGSGSASSCLKLESISGSATRPKPVRIKAESKPSPTIARIKVNQEHIDLGMRLLELGTDLPSNARFASEMRRRFDVDPKIGDAGHENAARAYAGKPEIYQKLSWNALAALASPTLPEDVRIKLEQQVLAGRKIGAADVRRARGGPMRTGRPKRPLGCVACLGGVRV
jgi:hypothetical protein